jgi:hypothetical protein
MLKRTYSVSLAQTRRTTMSSGDDYRLKAALQARQPEQEEEGGLELNANTGAAAGTLLGAIAGSFIPVVGTAAGGAIGGALGGLAGGAFGEDDVQPERALTDTARLAAAIGKYREAGKGA